MDLSLPRGIRDVEPDEHRIHQLIRETFEEAGIQLPDPRELVPFSHWITPEPAPIRFDTRFYLAKDPEGVEPADEDLVGHLHEETHHYGEEH